MPSFPAVYENGVFRPLHPIELAEGTRVIVETIPDDWLGKAPVPVTPLDVRALVPPGTDEATIEIYEIMSRGYNRTPEASPGRSNEPQP